MVDIAVAYPREGTIEFQSQYLFSNPESEPCQLFLQRLSLVEEVKEVAVRSARQAAEVVYCAECFSPREAANAIRRSLLGTGKHAKNGHSKNGSLSVNGK